MKKISAYVLLVISILLAGCDTGEKAISKNDANVSRQESKSVEIPIVTSDPFKELDLSLYINEGYQLLGSHVWMENEIPTGVIVLGKEGEGDSMSRSKLYAISFQYIFDKKADTKKWIIKNETRFEGLGRSGVLPENVIFLKLGMNNFGFATISTSSTQGWFGDSVDMYGLINGNFQNIGSFTLHEEGGDDSNGALTDSYGNELYEKTGEIFMEENTSKSFYDIKTKNQTFKPRKINAPKPTKQWEELYVFKNGKYVSTKQ